MTNRMTAIAVAAVLVVAAGCGHFPRSRAANVHDNLETQVDRTLAYVEGNEPEPAFLAVSQGNGEMTGDKKEALGILGRIRMRMDQIASAKAAGYVEETKRGYLELLSANVPSAEKRNEVQRLMAAENADRKNLYQAMAKLNKDRKISVSRVEATYAQQRAHREEAGR